MPTPNIVWGGVNSSNDDFSSPVSEDEQARYLANEDEYSRMLPSTEQTTEPLDISGRKMVNVVVFNENGKLKALDSMTLIRNPSREGSGIVRYPKINMLENLETEHTLSQDPEYDAPPSSQPRSINSSSDSPHRIGMEGDFYSEKIDPSQEFVSHRAGTEDQTGFSTGEAPGTRQLSFQGECASYSQQDSNVDEAVGNTGDFTRSHPVLTQQNWTEDDVEEFKADVYNFATAAGLNTVQAEVEVSKALYIWEAGLGSLNAEKNECSSQKKLERPKVISDGLNVERINEAIKVLKQAKALLKRNGVSSKYSMGSCSRHSTMSDTQYETTLNQSKVALKKHRLEEDLLASDISPVIGPKPLTHSSQYWHNNATGRSLAIRMTSGQDFTSNEFKAPRNKKQRTDDQEADQSSNDIKLDFVEDNTTSKVNEISTKSERRDMGKRARKKARQGPQTSAHFRALSLDSEASTARESTFLRLSLKPEQKNIVDSSTNVPVSVAAGAFGPAHLSTCGPPSAGSISSRIAEVVELKKSKKEAKQERQKKKKKVLKPSSVAQDALIPTEAMTDILESRPDFDLRTQSQGLDPKYVPAEIKETTLVKELETQSNNGLFKDAKKRPRRRKRNKNRLEEQQFADKETFYQSKAPALAVGSVSGFSPEESPRDGLIAAQGIQVPSEVDISGRRINNLPNPINAQIKNHNIIIGNSFAGPTIVNKGTLQAGNELSGVNSGEMTNSQLKKSLLFHADDSLVTSERKRGGRRNKRSKAEPIDVASAETPLLITSWADLSNTNIKNAKRGKPDRAQKKLFILPTKEVDIGIEEHSKDYHSVSPPDSKKQLASPQAEGPHVRQISTPSTNPTTAKVIIFTPSKILRPAQIQTIPLATDLPLEDSPVRNRIDKTRSRSTFVHHGDLDWSPKLVDSKTTPKRKRRPSSISRSTDCELSCDYSSQPHPSLRRASSSSARPTTNSRSGSRDTKRRFTASAVPPKSKKSAPDVSKGFAKNVPFNKHSINRDSNGRFCKKVNMPLEDRPLSYTNALSIANPQNSESTFTVAGIDAEAYDLLAYESDASISGPNGNIQNNAEENSLALHPIVFRDLDGRIDLDVKAETAFHHDVGSILSNEGPCNDNFHADCSPSLRSRKKKKIPSKSPYFSPPVSPEKKRTTGKTLVKTSATTGISGSSKETKCNLEHDIKADQQSPKKIAGGIVSCIPFPPLSAPHFGLIQEALAHDPFRLLIAVTFLIRTHGKHAIPVFYSLMEKYPTPQSLAKADREKILPIIRHLGLQNQRASTYQMYANIWLEDPPVKGKRYAVRGYPNKDSGKNVKRGEILSDDDEREAWEIGHMTQGPYAIDSWRIFCRDILRGEADGWNGEGSKMESFQPEWMRVMPEDKELRAYLRWMWLKEGFEWDPFTGEKEVASQDLMMAAFEGRIAWDDKGGMTILKEALEMPLDSSSE